MKIKFLVIALLISSLVFPSNAYGIPSTVVWEQNGDPVGGSAFGYTGVQAKTWVFNVTTVWDVANQETKMWDGVRWHWGGYHPQGLYMYGWYRYLHRDRSYQADMTEVGWVVDGNYNGSWDANGVWQPDLRPRIYSAVVWDNTIPAYKSFPSMAIVDANREITLNIQKKWDGSSYSWHGYYWRDVSPTIPVTEILWAGNSVTTGSPVSSSERRIQAYRGWADGAWHDGDIRLSNTPDWWGMIRRDRNADNSPRWWGPFGQIAEVDYGNFGGTGTVFNWDKGWPGIIPTYDDWYGSYQINNWGYHVEIIDSHSHWKARSDSSTRAPLSGW